MKIAKNQTISVTRLIGKTLLLFVLFNFLFILLKDIPYGRLSLYNVLFPGRERLPFGETPEESFNLTISNLDAMISSHKISGQKKSEDNYRIVLIGDSSIWGILQEPEVTLAGLLEENIDFLCAEKKIEVFNLGYPSLSVLKDLMILDEIKRYEPDLIVWYITLESVIARDQPEIPLVKNNPLTLNYLIDKYQVSYPKEVINPMDFSIIGQRRNLADIVRLQLYGGLWAGSGIDQDYPVEYNPAKRDFEDDTSYKNFNSQEITIADLAFDIIQKAISGNSGSKFILINEPILISTGKNSYFRYNFYYPRWAYDQYRNISQNYFNTQGIEYHDLWNLISESNFTNSAIHLNLNGEKDLSKAIMNIIKNHCDLIGAN